MTPTENFKKTQQADPESGTSKDERAIRNVRFSGPIVDPAERVRLVTDAASGDETSFERLVRAYRRSIFLVVRQKVYSEVEAEEVAQEVFVRAYFSLSKLRDPMRFVGWLHGIAHNCVLSYLEKKLRRSPPLPLQEDVASPVVPEPAPPGPLMKAVGGLPERYRQIVNLHFVEGLSQEEIAHSLVIAPGTVRSRLHRAVGILRKTLERNRPQ